MSQDVFRHPLAALRAQMGGLSAESYLKLVDRHHRARGFGAMATRREKVIRWESGLHAPDLNAQLAMASLHNITDEAVYELGWPAWLSLAFPADTPVLSAPWTPAGTVTAMAVSAQGGTVDRRGFLIASGTVLTAIVTDWSNAFGQAPAAAATTGRRRLTPEMVSRIDQRLDDLRHLDDVLGGGDLCRIASAEFRLLSGLADKMVYDDTTGRRLFQAVTEAGRIAGWVHFDQGRHAAAQSYYLSALRASATAGDSQIGSNVLAFMAIQTYSIDNPHDAVNLVEAALDQTRGHATPRVRAILHARAARAWSKTSGGKDPCIRELGAARDALALGHSDDDPAWAYWVTPGEIEMLAGSCALDLDEPCQAVRFFRAAAQADYHAGGYVRDTALFLTREAEAHLALGDLDQACGTAREALEHSGGVDSARPFTALADFRQRLSPYRDVPVAREFLQATA